MTEAILYNNKILMANNETEYDILSIASDAFSIWLDPKSFLDKLESIVEVENMSYFLNEINPNIRKMLFNRLIKPLIYKEIGKIFNIDLRHNVTFVLEDNPLFTGDCYDDRQIFIKQATTLTKKQLVFLISMIVFNFKNTKNFLKNPISPSIIANIFSTTFEEIAFKK